MTVLLDLAVIITTAVHFMVDTIEAGGLTTLATNITSKLKEVYMERIRMLPVLVLALVLTASFASADPAFAGGKGMHGEGHRASCKMKDGYHSRGWKSTLTEDQRAEMDAMHLALARELYVKKAELKVRKARLKVLVTGDSPDASAIDKLIDEVGEIKKDMMRARHNHKVELRKILTPEQRMGFDKHVLSKGHGGHGHKGHKGGCRH